MSKLMKRLSPARMIALGFALVILLGSLLLILPVSLREGVKLTYLDSLYTATSAVCVTGLVVVDAGDTFTLFGQGVLAFLIQIGGLGVAAMGAGIMLAIRHRIDLHSRLLVREAMNLNPSRGVITFLRRLFLMTLFFEITGAVLSLPAFLQDYPVGKAMWISLFHSIAAFNNAGFDVLGSFQSLTGYYGDVWLNVVTAALIISGGLGFLVIREIQVNRFNWKKYSLHAKVVLSMSAVLIVGGTLLLWVSEDITLLGAFFHSVSARTAGFATYSLGEFSNAGLIWMIILMFIGASPGSTGGGVKTTTVFILLQSIKSAATNKKEKAFHYSLPKDAFRKAEVIVLIGIILVAIATGIFLMLEPDISVGDALFEMTSAFATVGLSTGVTQSIGSGAKLLSMIMMYIGRLGPLTVATLWYFGHGERVSYPEGNIAIG